MQPFRFIHAADLRLDHLPAEVDWNHPEVSLVAEECTMTAFRRIVEAAVCEDVDFVLLTGRVFDDAVHSVKSETRFIQGCERLAGHGIDVYILCEEPGGGNEFPSLPENSHLLSDVGGSVLIRRDEDVLASLVICKDGTTPAIAKRSEPIFKLIADYSREYRVLQDDSDGASLPDEPEWEYEYVTDHDSVRREPGAALPQKTDQTDSKYCFPVVGTTRVTEFDEHGVTHFPGSAQGLSATESGGRGCTLVEVDADGESQLTFVPAASLRYETLEIAIQAETSHEDFFARLAEILQNIERSAADEAWIITWRMAGAGPLAELADDEDFRATVELAIHDAFPGDPSLVYSAGAVAGDEVAIPPAAVGELQASFLEHLDQLRRLEDGESEEVLQPEIEAEGVWSARLQDLRESIDADRIDAAAAQWGQIWFAETMEESA